MVRVCGWDQTTANHVGDNTRSCSFFVFWSREKLEYQLSVCLFLSQCAQDKERTHAATEGGVLPRWSRTEPQRARQQQSALAAHRINGHETHTGWSGWVRGCMLFLQSSCEERKEREGGGRGGGIASQSGMHAAAGSAATTGRWGEMVGGGGGWWQGKGEGQIIERREEMEQRRNSDSVARRWRRRARGGCLPSHLRHHGLHDGGVGVCRRGAGRTALHVLHHLHHLHHLRHLAHVHRRRRRRRRHHRRRRRRLRRHLSRRRTHNLVRCRRVVAQLLADVRLVHTLPPRGGTHLANSTLLALLACQLVRHGVVVLVLHVLSPLLVTGVDGGSGLDRLKQLRQIFFDHLLQTRDVTLLLQPVEARERQEIDLLEERLVLLLVAKVVDGDELVLQLHVLERLGDVLDSLALCLVLSEERRHLLLQHAAHKGVHQHLLRTPEHRGHPLVQALQRHHLRQVVQQVGLLLSEQRVVGARAVRLVPERSDEHTRRLRRVDHVRKVPEQRTVHTHQLLRSNAISLVEDDADLRLVALQGVLEKHLQLHASVELGGVEEHEHQVAALHEPPAHLDVVVATRVDVACRLEHTRRVDKRDALQDFVVDLVTVEMLKELVAKGVEPAEGQVLLVRQHTSADLLRLVAVQHYGELVRGGLRARPQVVAFEQVVDERGLAGREGAHEGHKRLRLHEGLGEPGRAEGVVLVPFLDGVDDLVVDRLQLCQHTLQVLVP
eukprot:Rhum_TRINITY_DN14269_c21_g1::Rhum_TRINITY_DN14269_c21_g1_i1::g.78637::m.78637